MKAAILFLPMLLLISLCTLSNHRLEVYIDEPTLWLDTVRKSPDKARPHNNLGDALKKIQDLNGAQQHFERALELQPDYPDALNNLAIIFTNTGRKDDAMYLLRKTLLLNPDHIQARYNLAMQYYERNLLNDADREYRTIIELDPFCAEAAFSGQMLKMIQKRRQTR